MNLNSLPPMAWTVQIRDTLVRRPSPDIRLGKWVRVGAETLTLESTATLQAFYRERDLITLSIFKRPHGYFLVCGKTYRIFGQAIGEPAGVPDQA